MFNSVQHLLRAGPKLNLYHNRLRYLYPPNNSGDFRVIGNGSLLKLWAEYHAMADIDWYWVAGTNRWADH